MVVPEILAPAGSMEALKAAIANGADAVYLGGKLFNARQYAANFDDREIVEAVKLTHGHQIKVYVTVNILLHNNELDAAANYLKFLYNIGVDGIIIQDLGLLYLAKEVAPNLKLHASTQMAIHNLAGVQFFAERGMERVVLARELSLQDIESIYQGCKVELEVFVHGALCICYSGQCLMSSMIGGRSGNRGRCAQPCRLPYRLQSGEGIAEAPGDYLLSPKDLSTIDILPELIASGVHSLKFEGRMKRPEYVATVIRIYRQALDRCLDDPDHFRATEEERRQLAQVFNRDFSVAYYKGNPGRNLISYQRPNNRGIYLGRIGGIDAKTKLVTVKLEQPLNLGDGLEFWVSKGGRKGITVKEIKLKGENISYAPIDESVEIEAPLQAKVGDRIFKTHDGVLMETARTSFTKDFQEPTIPVSMKVTGSLGKSIELTVWDDQGNLVQAETKFLAEKARNKPLTKEVLLEQLGRLGNTGFTLTQLKADIADNIMVPLSELNALRRKVIAQLDRLQNQRERQPIDEKDFEYAINRLKKPRATRSERLPRLVLAVGDPRSLEMAVEAGANDVYLSGEHFRSKKWMRRDYAHPIKQAKDKGVKIYYSLPRLWLESNAKVMESLGKELGNIPLDGLVASNPGAIIWARRHFADLPLILDYPFNLMNDFSLEFVAQIGIQGITLSPELTLQEIAEMKIPLGLEFEGLIHGALPLMVSEHCVVGGVLGCRTKEKPCSKPCIAKKFSLRDRRDYLFPAEMDQFCRMHIFNSQDLCLIDTLPSFVELGYHRIRIEARKDSPDYVKGVTTAYRKALDDLSRGQKGKLGEQKKELERFAPQGLTKGHYFRGV